MSILENLPAIKQSLMRKNDQKLIDILSYSQDDYDIDVLPLVDEILLERGVSIGDINSYKHAYASLKSELALQPKMHKTASFWVRFCQYIIDHFIFFGICYVIQYVLAKNNALNDKDGSYQAWCLLAYVLYYSLTIELFKATWGMSIMGLTLVTKEKKQLTFGYGISRATGMIVNIILLV